MSTSNKYENMSTIDALEYAKNEHLLLPDIQREYVWDINEIEALFESIVDDYPIGSCIFWKTNRTTINEEKPNLYYFLREFKKEVSKNGKIPEFLNDEGDYYIVLDGQQRITSLNIALYGSYTYYKGGRGYLKSNPASWIEKELYYNLDFYNTTEEKDEEHPSKRFCFLTKKDAENGNYYKVKEILAYDASRKFIDSMIRRNFHEKCQDDLSILFDRIHDSSNNGLIHYYCINEKSYDSALDIFVRVNSTGRKLSKSDLLFSTLIDGWSDGKSNIDNLIDIMNSKGDGFKFTRDYLMRLCLVLVGEKTDLKITSLTQKTIKDIRDNWEKIKSSLNDMSTLLKDIGFSDKYLTSYNATMPIAYFIYKGGKIKDEESKKETRKFLSVSLAKRLFGVASNDALNKTAEVLSKIDCPKTKFSLNLFSSLILTGDRTFIVEEKNIDTWLDNYKKGKDAYILLTLLYPDLKLSQNEFHQDHCHPYVAFDNKNIKLLNISQEKLKEWQEKRNLLPNLQFLEGGENKEKNKTPLKKWVEQGKDFKYHPKDLSLELKDFDTFYFERRKLMKNELMKIFGISKSLN